jgi:pyruvate dehydrogenase E1 component alpha subunit
MAELFGKETGAARGRGGSMHLFDVERRFMGGYAIVGGSLPLSVGVGLAIDYRGGDEIVYTLFGEGTTNIGAFYESMNLAKLWKLPMLFFCNNNQYAMGSKPGDDSAVADVYKKACAFDMRAERVDGLDVLAVREAAERFVKYTREAQDPTLLELFCYRLRGHSMADPARYRTPEEVQSWAARDPILRFRQELEGAQLLSAADIRSIDQQVDEGVAEAVDFAEQSPNPDPATLFDGIYADRSVRV